MKTQAAIETQNPNDLFSRARGGDVEARNELLAIHREAVRRLIDQRLDRRIRTRVDAEDVCQDTLIEAFKRLDGYFDNPTIPFLKWITGIARDRMLDAYRRHHSAKRSVDLERGQVEQGDGLSPIDLATDRGQQPLAMLVDREDHIRCLQAIDRLEDMDREIIVLRHIDQRTNREISQRLGMSDAASSMRYIRAVRRLKNLVGELIPA